MKRKIQKQKKKTQKDKNLVLEKATKKKYVENADLYKAVLSKIRSTRAVQFRSSFNMIYNLKKCFDRR